MIDLVPKGLCNKKVLVDHGEFSSDVLDQKYYRSLEITSTLSPLKIKIYNKLEGNSELASKKKLLHNMKSYYLSKNQDPFTKIPLSFHLINGSSDTNFPKVLEQFKKFEENLKSDPHLNNLWIVKPGEATNRGIGIKVCGSLSEISEVLDEKRIKSKVKRTYIVQKYLYRPLLYNNRKFDIRCYVLVTIFNNNIQGYLYKEGYLRTSCSEFSLDMIQDKFIHLTNDAVQKNSPDYGKFEDGNKLSYDEFQEYLESNGQKVEFKQQVCPKIKELVQDSLQATWKNLDPFKRFHCFEVFGYDFMIDEMFEPWLIEVNTNPCLALSGKYLNQLIPDMLTHTFEITLNQLFPTKEKLSGNNLYELVFAQVLNTS
jgi:tubulin--tyrosine ligase